MNVKELTHSQQQPQAPKTHKKKPPIRHVLDEVKCKTHTQQSKSSSESPETVNLRENPLKGHFKGSLLLL